MSRICKFAEFFVASAWWVVVVLGWKSANETCQSTHLALEAQRSLEPALTSTAARCRSIGHGKL